MRDLVAAERFYGKNRKKKIGLLIIFLIIIAGSVAVFPGSISNLTKRKTEKEIHVLLVQFNNSYKHKDIEGLMTFYSQTPDVTAIGTGMQGTSVGREAIKSGYQREFSEFHEIQAVEDKILSISISKDMVSLCADRYITVLKGDRKVKVNGVFSAVLRKINGKWLFTQTHFSLPPEQSFLIYSG